MIYALAFKRRVCSDSSVSRIPKRKHLACTTKLWTFLKLWRLDPGLAAGPTTMEAALVA